MTNYDLAKARKPASSVGVERSRKTGKKLDHLTRDVLDAQAAGMSYGQYKAQHPRTYVEPEYAPPAPKPDPGMRELVCVHCGAKFLASKQKSNKQYCSEECRERASNARARERKPPKTTEMPCAYCGKVFQSVRGAKYCCGECYTQAQRQKARESYKNKQNGGAKND